MTADLLANALLDGIPEVWPGLRIVTPDGEIHHIRKERRKSGRHVYESALPEGPARNQ